MNRKKPWLKNYPENTPEEIAIDPRKTLVRVLDEAETEYPDITLLLILVYQLVIGKLLKIREVLQPIYKML